MQTRAESPQIKVKSNQYVNLVYASYVLKETIARLQENITDDSLDLPEQLELPIPDFQDHDNSDQDVVFDLKALIDTINKQEAPALSHLDEDVETVLERSDEVTTNRSMTIIALVTGGLTLVILAVLCMRRPTWQSSRRHQQHERSASQEYGELCRTRLDLRNSISTHRNRRYVYAGKST